MKFRLLCLFLSVCFGSLQASEIEGFVKSDNETLPLAVVFVQETKFTVQTNENGFYKIENLKPGTYHLQVSYVGYQSNIRKVVVKDNQKLKLNFNLQPHAFGLDEVAVTGTMKEQSRSASPVPVEIFSQKFFQKSGSTNLFEGLQMVNGVLPTMNCNVCNTGDIHINGLEGPYTLVLIDGMPIVSALSSVYGLSGIPNSLIERVEVVKGPAASLYGSEAVGGLVNVITKKPEKAPFVFVDMMANSTLEKNLDFSIKSKHKNAYQLTGINLFHFLNRLDVNDDGFTDIPTQLRFSFFNKWQYGKKDFEGSVASRFFTEKRFGGQLNFDDKWMGTDSIYGETIYTNRFEIIGKQAYRLKNQAFNIQYSYNYHDQYSAYGTTWFIARQHTGFLQNTFNKKLGLRHDLLGGMSLRYTWYDDNSIVTSSSDGKFNQPINTYLPGIFVQDEISIHSNHTLLLGLRYDYYKNHGNIFSPRVNYRFKPNQTETWRLSVGNGFRVVNLFTEDHAALTGSRTVIIKEELKPEQSWNANLNYNKFINFKKGFLSIDASMFYTIFNNRIQADYDTDPNAIIYANLAEHAVSRGLTLNTELSFTFPVKLNAGITLMEVYTMFPKTTGGLEKRQQLHAPPFSGTYQLSYEWRNMDMSFDLSGQVYSPMRLPILPNDFRPEYSPWFGLMNLQVSKKFKKGIESYIGVKNLLNFLPKNPIIRPFDPFDKTANDPISNPNAYTFDPSYNYAPMLGRRIYAGIRVTIR